MSDAADPSRDVSPYQLAKELVDQGLEGPEIKRRLMEQGVAAEAATLLVGAVGAPMPAPELDLEVDVKTAVSAVKDLRPMLNRSNARKALKAVRSFLVESLRFSPDGERRLARNAIVGLFAFLAGVVATAVMYLSTTEFLVGYVLAAIPTALGISHFLYGLTHVGR